MNSTTATEEVGVKDAPQDHGVRKIWPILTDLQAEGVPAEVNDLVVYFNKLVDRYIAAGWGFQTLREKNEELHFISAQVNQDGMVEMVSTFNITRGFKSATVIIRPRVPDVCLRRLALALLSGQDDLPLGQVGIRLAEVGQKISIELRSKPEEV